MNGELNLVNLLSVWKKIANQHGFSWKNSFLKWDLPTDVWADFALTLALPISHKIKKNPNEIVQRILEETNCSELEYSITKQGYINFQLPNSYYQKIFNETLLKNGQNLRGEKKNLHLNLEYVSANPTGYLHLAHFRHAVIGNTLANVYQFCGYPLTREYYVNDRGVQVISLIKSVYHFYHKLQNKPLLNSEKIEYSGQATQKIAQELIKKWGDNYVNKELNEEELKLWRKEILELILAKIQQDLAKCGIEYDVWFSETSLHENEKDEEILNFLEEKNLTYFEEEAKLFKSSLVGDEKDRAIIKKDGEYTYFFSDIIYHQNKLKRANKIINIWGADHHGYVNRIKAACQLLSDKKEEDVQIILVQVVNLLTEEGKTAKFSKRAGNTIELEEALTHVDIDQLKFFLLEKEPNQPLSINTKSLKENKEKTQLYYIQYAHARCHQIFQKAQEKGMNKIDSNIDLLEKNNERKIFKLLIRFPFVLENIIEENKPHHLVHYLHDLAQAWQAYYQNEIILEEKNPKLTAQKLLLVKNIQIILKLGLDLMGISAPNIM
ncbi:MAG: Arginine--tRNA ligase [Mycoplasmataceae bacterium]|nr:MAG: Arginine--tRNA ligase [Mycoplasmataceae bacterium]